MEAEGGDEQTQSTPQPSVWDQAEAALQEKASPWDAAEAALDRSHSPQSTVINAGGDKDPGKAARVIRAARKFSLPEKFVEPNLDEIEGEEKKGALASEDLVNSNPKIAALAAKSPNWSATLLPNLPILKKLELMYQRTPDQWPVSEAEYGPIERKKADARADRDWEAIKANPGLNGTDEYGRNIPLMWSTKQEMADDYYKAQMAMRKEKEDFIAGTGPVGAGEAFMHTLYQNPFKFFGFGGDAFEVANLLSLKDALVAVNQKRATPEQEDELLQWARLQRAAERRGTSFTGKLTEQLMGIPAFVQEVAATSGLYEAAEGATFKGGKALSEKFLKGQLSAILEKGFGQSILKKGVSSALASVPQGAIARSLSGLSGELQENLQKSFDQKQIIEDADGNVHIAPEPGRDVPISMPWTVFRSLVKGYNDIVGMHAGAGLTKPFDNALIRAIAGSDAGPVLATAQNRLREIGLNGFLGMMGQGEITKALESVTGGPEYKLPSREDIAVAAIAGGAPHAMALPFDVLTARREVKRAQLIAEAFKRRGELSGELLKDAPELKPDVLTGLSEGGANSTTLVPAEKFDAHNFKDANGNSIPPAQKAKEMGISEAQYHAALTAKQDLAIPSGKWDEVVGQTSDGRAFDTVAKHQPDEMSLDEAQEYIKRTAADMAADQRSTEAAERAKRSSANMHLNAVEKSTGPNEGKLVFKYDNTPAGLALTEAEERVGGPASAFSDERARKDLPPEREDRIAKDLQEAHDSNVEAFTKLVMEEQEERKGKEWAQKKESLKPEVAKEVDAQPSYKALYRLKSHTAPDGSSLPDGTPEIKLSREALREMGIEERILPKGTVEGGVIEGQHAGSTGRGIHPDEAAQMLGYPDGHSLIQALIDANDRYPREELISEKAEELMERRFGPRVTDPERAREEALRIVNRDFAKRIMKADRDWLLANRPETVRGMLKDASARPIPDDVIEDSVSKTIEEMPNGQLDPRIAEAAMRKAAAEAERAIWKGDFDTAIAAIQRRLINHEFWKQATEARKLAKNTFDTISDLGWSSSYNRPGNAEFGQQFKAFAERLGIRQANPRDMAGRLPLAKWLDSLQDSITLDTGKEPIQIESQWLDETYRPKPEELTVSQVEALADTLKQLKGVAKDRNEATVNGKRIERELVKQSVLADIEKANPKDLQKRGLTNKPAVGRTLDAFTMRPEEFLIRLVGDRADSTLAELTINRASEAGAEFNDLWDDYRKKMEKARDAVPEEIAKRQNELIKVPGLETAVTRKEAIGMVANGGNESNFTKMVGGEKKRSQGRGLTKDQIIGVTNQLTREEVLFGQALMDAQGQFFDRASELQKRLTGLNLPKIEAKPMLPCLEREGCRGGFYHMMYDFTEPSKSAAGEKQLSQELGRLYPPSWKSSTTNGGYRKSRIESYSAPVDFNIDRSSTYMRSMLMDLTHRELAVDWSKFAHDPDIQQAIVNKFGPEYKNFLSDWLARDLNDYASPSDQSISQVDKWIGRTKSAVTNVALGYRLTTNLKHTLAVESCVDAIGKGDLAEGGTFFYRGVKSFFSAPFDNWKQIKEESGEMRHFAEHSDAAAMDALTDLQGKDTWLAKVKRFGIQFATFGNILRAGATYMGAKEKAMLDYAKDGYSGEELDRVARLEAERAVRLGVGSGAAKDIPAMMSRDNKTMRAVTMFYTPGSVNLSRMMSAVSGFKKTGDMPRLLMRVAGWWLAGATLHHLAGLRAPDEEKDETWGGELGKALLKYPVEQLPGGKTIGEPIIDRMLGEPMALDMMGKDPLLSPAYEGLKALDTTLKAANGDEEWEKAIEHYAKTAGYFTGVPSAQMVDSAGYLWDVAKGNQDPNDLGEFMHAVLVKRPKSR